MGTKKICFVPLEVAPDANGRADNLDVCFASPRPNYVKRHFKKKKTTSSVAVYA
jgi:hypothetical protein